MTCQLLICLVGINRIWGAYPSQAKGLFATHTETRGFRYSSYLGL